MEYVKLNGTDLKVSRIGFGCFQLPLVSKKKSSELIQTASGNGINFFETARDYRDSEEKIGNVLHDFPSLRGQIVLATKTGAKIPIDVRKTFDVSLKKLRTNYIDIYTMQGVNTMDKFNHCKSTVLPELRELKREGKIRYIGMSSHDINIVKEAKKNEFYEIDVFFVPANIMLRKPIATGIPIVVLKPFGGYKYSYMQGQDAKYISDVKEFDRWFDPKIALNYLFQFDNVQSILCGFTSIDEISADCSVEKERKINSKTREKFKFGKFGNYCNQCGKCKCPNGIRIPFLMKLWEYYDFYNIKRWTKKCYNMLDADIRDCDICLQCEETCPLHIDIVTTLQKLEVLRE